MSDSQKIAREIVDRILDTRPSDFCPFPRLAAIREEWVALVTQVIEEALLPLRVKGAASRVDLDEVIRHLEAEHAKALKRAQAAEKTVASIATMLGWMNVPPQDTLERDIKAHRARLEAAEKERDDWKQAALTNNETIGLLGDQKAVLKAEVERLTTLRYESVCSEGTAIVATCLACGGLFAKLSPMSDVDCPTCKRERLTQRVRELEAGLRTCADKFREYEALHLKKVPDGVCAVPIAEEFPMVCGVCGRSRPMHEMAERMRAKAGVNASMAATCEALLSQPPAPQPSEPPYVSKVKCADPFGCDPAYGCFDGSEPCSKAPSEPAPLHGCEICAGDDACTCPRMPSGRPMRLSDLPSEPAPPATTPEGAEDVELCPSTEAYCETCGDVHEMTNRCGNPLPCPLHPSPEPERCQQLKLDPNAKNNETFLTEDCGNPLPCNLHPQPCDVTDLDGFPCDAKTPCNLHPEGR